MRLLCWFSFQVYSSNWTTQQIIEKLHSEYWHSGAGGRNNERHSVPWWVCGGSHVDSSLLVLFIIVVPFKMLLLFTFITYLCMAVVLLLEVPFIFDWSSWFYGLYVPSYLKQQISNFRWDLSIRFIEINIFHLEKAKKWHYKISFPHLFSVSYHTV